MVPVCKACVARVRRSQAIGCNQCGEALDLEINLEDIRFAGVLTEGFLCRECRMVPPEFARAVSFGTYTGELRSLVHLLKFERVPAVAALLGDRLAAAMLQLQPAAAECLLVVAVPLFAAHQRKRGYNQSVLLAEAAMQRLRRLRPEWRLTAAHAALRRRRSTESSFVLSRKGRRRNLAGAFEAMRDVRGKQVLLVDDIYTSGATARECARVLRRAGAEKVWVATLARAQKREIARQYEQPETMVARWDMAPTSGGDE